MSLILPWWSKWAALAALIATTNAYTGLKVASHYQDKLAAIEQIGVAQKQKIKIIYHKQREVSTHVTQTFTDAVSASDEHYRMLYASAGNVPQTTAVAGTFGTTSPAGIPDPRRCTEKDGAADAIHILQLQRWYSGIMAAQD